jgi:hypothetical protein
LADWALALAFAAGGDLSPEAAHPAGWSQRRPARVTKPTNDIALQFIAMSLVWNPNEVRGLCRPVGNVGELVSRVAMIGL